MLHALDRLHAWLRRSPLLARLTAFTRVLLAVGFFPPGMKKVLLQRFTQLPVEHPVGFFFEAFYRATAWYWLAGAAQVLAALLLLVPRTAHLGALLFLPVIVNITTITWSIDFQGTKFITLLMLLATLYLLAWDWDRLRGLWPHRLARGEPRPVRELALGAALFAAGGVAAAIGIAALRLGNTGWAQLPRLAGALAVLGALFGAGVALHLRAMPAGERSMQAAEPPGAKPG